MNRYLLFGNPNVGKTSVFNFLTDSNENVSNFEGVTVSRKSATLKASNDLLTDIPGVYSINTYTVADDVSQQALLNESFDGLIDVLNINDLKRNMYLLIDLLETGKPVNAIFNIDDLFTGEINLDLICERLSIKAFKGNHANYSENLKEITRFKTNTFHLDYGVLIEEAITQVEGNFNSDINDIT